MPLQFPTVGKFISIWRKMNSSLKRSVLALEAGEPWQEGEGGADVDCSLPEVPSKEWAVVVLYLYSPARNARPSLANSSASRRIWKCNHLKLCVKMFECSLKTLPIISISCLEMERFCAFFFFSLLCRAARSWKLILIADILANHTFLASKIL